MDINWFNFLYLWWEQGFDFLQFVTFFDFITVSL